jgi:hypothetical protein
VHPFYPFLSYILPESLPLLNNQTSEEITLPTTLLYAMFYACLPQAGTLRLSSYLKGFLFVIQDKKFRISFGNVENTLPSRGS